MEEYVTRLVENTFKNHDIEEVKEIVIERILYYEMKLLNSVSKDKIKEKIKGREHIIHNAKLKYGKDYEIYDDVIYARYEIELLKELLEE